MQSSLVALLRTGLNLWFTLLLLTAAVADAGSLSVVGKSRWVEVGSIIDGDTFRSRSGEKIRLLGINTPEIAHDNQPSQPFGPQAKRQLSQLISGKTVRLQLDRERKDRFGRTLAQIYLRDGSWINELLVKDGLAYTYTFAPNFRWTKALLKAETEARRAMRGIWKSEAFRVVDAVDVNRRQIGEFRLIRGYIQRVEKWRFQLGKVTVTVPRSARKWFENYQIPQHGQRVIVRGQLRTNANGTLFLALHSPYDLE